MKKEERKLYCCYSLPQKDYLKTNGINYEIVALNKNTKCTMWIYTKTEKLNELLNQWTLGCKN